MLHIGDWAVVLCGDERRGTCLPIQAGGSGWGVLKSPGYAEPCIFPICTVGCSLGRGCFLSVSEEIERCLLLQLERKG